MKKGYLSIAFGIAAVCLFSACAGGETEKQEEPQTTEEQVITGEGQDMPDDTEQEDEKTGMSENESAQEAEALNSDSDDGNIAGEMAKEYAEVKEIGADFFTVAEIETEELDNGALTAVMSLDEGEWNLYDVLYTDKTEFIVRTVSSGGMEYTDAAGSAADLEKDVNVNMIGSWEGDHFNATQIIIEHFIR